MKRNNHNRMGFRADDMPAFIFMHVIFFLVQLFFFWIYFQPTSFTEWNIPIIYCRIQQIGYPIVLICSLIWMNRAFFPEQAKYIVISIVVFLVEWLGVDRWILH
jgi:hypothetical protein